MMFRYEIRLPSESVYDTFVIPPSDAEIATLQERHLEHIQDLEKYRKESNAKALE